jgi:hypothetical protein
MMLSSTGFAQSTTNAAPFFFYVKRRAVGLVWFLFSVRNVFLFFYLLLIEEGDYLVEEGFRTGGEAWWGLWF